MRRLIVASSAIALLLGGQAKADLIFSNGLVNGEIGGQSIYGGTTVTDSFTVSAGTTLTEAQIGLWLLPGDAPGTLDWAIGTSPSMDDVSSGFAAPLSNTYQFTNGTPADIYESTFSLSGTLSAGTYWLTLNNATTGEGNNVLWDITGGSSTAYSVEPGAMAGSTFLVPIPSESFQIYGNALVVPEPTGLMIATMTIAIAALASFAKRLARRRRLIA